MRSANARAMARPAWADFDLVTIPADADPERVANELAARPDVEYAQARYLNHAMFRPNDQFYSRQWNFPAIDMERAWDINAGASSDVIVAVLDSGVAFRNALIRFEVEPFRLETGRAGLPRARPHRRAVRGRARSRRRQPLRVAARLHLGRRPAARHGRPRHPRGGDDRPGHQQHRRRRRDGVQRPDHAGQGDQRGLGRHLRQPQLRHRRPAWRAASATPPTTARTSST